MALFSQWTFRNILWKCNFVSTDVSRMVSVKEICWFLYIRNFLFETYIFVVFSEFILFWNLISCFYFCIFILLYYLTKLKIENHEEKKNKCIFDFYFIYIIFYYIFYISYISRYQQFINQLTYQYILISYIFNNFLSLFVTFSIL